MLAVALLSMLAGLWLLLKVDGQRMALAGIVGSVVLAFGAELGLAVCYVIGASR